MTPHRYTPSSSAAVQSETAAGAAPPGPYYGKLSQITLVNIQGLDIELSYKYFGVHLNIKLGWSKNTDVLYKKGKSHLDLLRRLRSFGVCRTLLKSCTDVLCCLIFIIVILSYVALGIVGLALRPTRTGILHVESAKLNAERRTESTCPTGHDRTRLEHRPRPTVRRFRDGQYTGWNKPILFYFNILKCTNPAILINLQCPTTQMCVSKCPDKFATYTEMQLQHKLSKSYWEYYKQFCKPGFNNPDKPVSQVLRDEDCPSMIVPSRPFFQRCLPDFITLNGTVTVANRTRFKDALEMARSVTELQHAAKGITGLVDTKELGIKIVEDYAKSWTWILIGLLLSFTVSLVFILLLRFTAGWLLWMTIITVILLLAYGMWYCSMELSQLRLRPGSDVAIIEVGLQTDLQIYLQLTQTWIILLVSLGATEASILLMLIFLRRRVRVAIALLREASKAIGHIMSTLFYPVITFLLLTVFISYWAVTAVYLASSGEAVYKVMSPDVSCPYANTTCNPESSGGSSDEGKSWSGNYLVQGQGEWRRLVQEEVRAAVMYHTGSLAFGALILSVVQLIRIILEYLEQKLKGIDNSLSRFIMHCLKCCFWCLEKLIRYMNHNAYIMVAIYGKNLCTSAREAFFLLMRNVVRVAVLDRVTDFLLFLGKILIAGGVGVIAFFFFTRKIPVIQEEVPNLNYYWVPLLV
ncbi:choline transporter-like protein 5-B [Morone saxatilis]|uniref:choline transporter-like protein 5-B n=1 Tax=Morone saxatilis TaxID=34816 RepID=UPI0015E21ACC|nr:choline transporter-like protein 5-B [Morone saxatilis]